MTLLPGFVLYALAAGGLFFSVWRLRHRLLLLAGVLVTMVLAMGTRFFDGTFTYVPLFEHAAGLERLRTPGRLMLWATLLLGLLAAGAVTAFADRVRELAAAADPVLAGPVAAAGHPAAAAAGRRRGPEQHAASGGADPAGGTCGRWTVRCWCCPAIRACDQHVMLWSTSRFQDVVNGGSGFTPRQLDEVRRVTQTFPDQASVDYLRELGVRTVVLLRGQARARRGRSPIDAPVDGLGITPQEIARRGGLSALIRLGGGICGASGW